MRRPGGVLPLLAILLPGVADVAVRKANADDGRVATVLDGRRLFFDDATRRQLDAAQQDRDGGQRDRLSPESRSQAPAEPPARAGGEDDGKRGAGAAAAGGQATVDGRLGRQRIVDGIPLQGKRPRSDP